MSNRGKYYKQAGSLIIALSCIALSSMGGADNIIQKKKPAIADVAPTMLRLFGLRIPTHIDGKPWAVALRAAQ